MLKEKLTTRNMTLSSRLVLPPMATQKSDGGNITNELIDYYAGFARNPLLGLIITEHAYIDAQGKADPHQVSFASDGVITNQKKLTDTVHSVRSDIKIAAQISHAGINTSAMVTGQELVSASAMEGRGGKSRELTKEEIEKIEDSFADAAGRVKEAGYDAVEIHAAHGYLFNQFYSPLTNKRTDEFGADSIENRLRFLLETVRKVKKSVGEDFPVIVRLGGCDYQEGGSTIADAVKASRILEKENIEFLDLTGGMNAFIRKGHTEPGYFSDMTETVKKEVEIPVMLTGGIVAPAEACRMLNENKADLIGVGRAMLRNPMWGM